MYSDEDLDAAVTAGVLQPAHVAALRDFVAAERASPVVDEENFRLITGFNDIFVSIASVLVLVAVAWLGGGKLGAAIGAALVAAVAWGLAAYFTRERRMALPSILLLLAFVGGVFISAGAILFAGSEHGFDWYRPGTDTSIGAVKIAVAAFIAAAAAYAHWRRFRVPITVAAGTFAAVGTAFALVLAATGASGGAVRLVTFVGGLVVFALAMWWDMSDPERRTRRADVAFWLHLLAAPLIVHPVFSTFGRGSSSSFEALIVILLYVALAVVALAVDRRALMVSALAYVLYAFGRLFQDVGALSPAITALLIGSALLLLSAFWHSARGAVLGQLSPGLRLRLPPLGRPVSRPPAS